MRIHTHQRTLVGLFTAALLVAVLAGPVGTAAFAVDEIPVPPPPQPVQVALGMVGLAHLQTARLNVVMIGGGSPDPGGRCRVALSFFDTAGQPFSDASGMPIATDVTLVPDQAARLNLRQADAFRDRTGLRVAFRARMQALDPPPTTGADPCRRVVATLEVFDNLTGRTSLLYFPHEPGEIPFGMVGLARLQTARLNVAAIGGGTPDPGALPACPVALGFVNSLGEPFLDASGLPIAVDLTLDPGKAGALDLRAADAFRGLTGMRVAFRAVLRVGVAVPPNPFCQPPVATLEVFDNLTGRTMVLYFPHDPGE